MELRRLSISEQVKEFLLSRIVGGLIKPGDRIIEAYIAKELDVSNIPVREAIKELVFMGVLQSEPHKGAWLREISLGETIDALHVKSVLEQKAILQAREKLQVKLPELNTLVMEILSAAESKDYVSYGKYNHKFHRTMIQESNNPLIVKYWESLSFEVCDSFILKVIKDQEPVAVAKEHQIIVDSISAGDFLKASTLAYEHINNLIMSLKKMSKPISHSLYKIFELEKN